jgi:hypothetical protein
MSNPNDELERIKRIRDQQISQRDPRARDKAFYGQISQRRRSRKLTFQSVIKDFQAKWLWMLLGGLIGAVVAVLFTGMVQAKWAEYIGYVIVLAGIVIGRFLGAVMDWRDDDWDKKY